MKRSKKKEACPVREKRWSSWKRNVSLLKCECNGAAMLHFWSLRRWCSPWFTTSKWPRPTMRHPPHKSEPCLVKHRSRSASFADRLFSCLAVSEYISLSLCVFSGQVRVSSHVNQQEHVKQQEAAKPCQIGKIVCFLHSKMLPFKKFSGLRPQTPTCKAPPFTAGYAPVMTFYFKGKLHSKIISSDVKDFFP